MPNPFESQADVTGAKSLLQKIAANQVLVAYSTIDQTNPLSYELAQRPDPTNLAQHLNGFSKIMGAEGFGEGAPAGLPQDRIYVGRGLSAGGYHPSGGYRLLWMLDEGVNPNIGPLLIDLTTRNIDPLQVKYSVWKGVGGGAISQIYAIYYGSGGKGPFVLDAGLLSIAQALSVVSPDSYKGYLNNAATLMSSAATPVA